MCYDTFSKITLRVSNSLKSGNVAFILAFNHDRQMPRWQGGVQTAADLLATITSSDMIMTVSWTASKKKAS